MKIKEKAQRLTLALRDSIDAWHGVDLVDDVVEVLEHVTVTESERDDAVADLSHLKTEVARLKDDIAAKLEHIVDDVSAMFDKIDTDNTETMTLLCRLVDGLSAINGLIESDETDS